MINIVILVVQLVILVASFLIGKVIPGASQETIQDITAKVNLIVDYADKFVSWAKYFLKNESGTQKMNKVVEQLKMIADRYNLDISEDEIRAIAQKAYDSMQAGIEAAEIEKKKVDFITPTTLLEGTVEKTNE